MNTKAIGMLSREYRKSLNINAETIAEKMGKTYQAIYGFERGEVNNVTVYLNLYSKLGSEEGGREYLQKATQLMFEGGEGNG